MNESFDDIVRETALCWQREFPERDSSVVPLFISLGYLSRRLQRFHDAVLKPHGRTLTEYQVLAVLRMNGARSPARLNDLLLLTPAGVTNTLDRLEKGGLVRRRAGQDDRRSILIELTANGRRHAETLLIAELEAQQALLAGTNKSERSALGGAVASLIEAFEASGT